MIANDYLYLAKLHYKKSELQDAEKYALNCLDILQISYRIYQKELSSTLMLLSLIFLKQERYVDSHTTFRMAMNIYVRKSKEHDKRIYLCLISMLSLSLRQRDIYNAWYYCKRAIIIGQDIQQNIAIMPSYVHLYYILSNLPTIDI
jgi:hypothetical protein